jgi:hypothetical protein
MIAALKYLPNGLSEEGVPAFTGHRIQRPKQIIADGKAGRAPPASNRSNEGASGVEQMLTMEAPTPFHGQLNHC